MVRSGKFLVMGVRNRAGGSSTAFVYTRLCTSRRPTSASNELLHTRVAAYTIPSVYEHLTRNLTFIPVARAPVEYNNYYVCTTWSI